MSLRAASARIDVSPSQPVVVSGNAMPERPISRIADPIEWQAVKLALNGEECLILSGDFLSLGEWPRVIAQRVLGLAPDRVFAIATHCHSAPAIDERLPVLGAVDPGYRKFCEDRLTALLDELAGKPMEPVIAHHTRSRHDGAVYRRRRGWRLKRPFRRVLMQPDERVAHDQTLDLIDIRRGDGTSLAVLWNWACHPTCFPDRSAISADFPGLVRQTLRNTSADPDCPVLFLQGFAGDLRPRLYDEGQGGKARVKRLLIGKSFGPVGEREWRAWSKRIGEAVSIARQSAEPLGLDDCAMRFSQKHIPLDALQDITVPDRPLCVQRLALGRTLELVALSCEPVNGLRSLFDGSTGQAITICAGYLDHIFGYLPTDRQLAEGGYEAEGFRHNFSLPGRYMNNIEERLRQALSTHRSGE